MLYLPLHPCIGGLDSIPPLEAPPACHCHSPTSLVSFPGLHWFVALHDFAEIVGCSDERVGDSARDTSQIQTAVAWPVTTRGQSFSSLPGREIKAKQSSGAPPSTDYCYSCPILKAAAMLPLCEYLSGQLLQSCPKNTESSESPERAILASPCECQRPRENNSILIKIPSHGAQSLTLWHFPFVEVPSLQCCSLPTQLYRSGLVLSHISHLVPVSWV